MWYVARKTAPDPDLLSQALRQQGPWAGQPIAVTGHWVRENMEATIRRIDWSAARDDVQRFLPLREQGLRAWSADFFLHHLARMNDVFPRNDYGRKGRFPGVSPVLHPLAGRVTALEVPPGIRRMDRIVIELAPVTE